MATQTGSGLKALCLLNEMHFSTRTVSKVCTGRTLGSLTQQNSQGKKLKAMHSLKNSLLYNSLEQSLFVLE